MQVVIDDTPSKRRTSARTPEARRALRRIARCIEGHPAGWGVRHGLTERWRTQLGNRVLMYPVAARGVTLDACQLPARLL